MRILKSESFDYNDDIGLVDFVNENSISKNDIQQIVANNYNIILFYWEEEKLHVPTSRKNKNDYELNATEKYNYAYQQAVDNMNRWR